MVNQLWHNPIGFILYCELDMPILVHPVLTWPSFVGLWPAAFWLGSYRPLLMQRVSSKYLHCVLKFISSSTPPSYLLVHWLIIGFSSSAISKVGQRIPLAHRFAKMLENLIVKHCGTLPELPVSHITFPRPLEDGVLHTLFEESLTSETSISLHESLHEPGSFMSLA